MPSHPFTLQHVATFSALGADHLARLEARLEQIPVARGTCVVEEGGDADALFVVLSGRFAVEIAGHGEPVTEIGQGATIGEIAFFAGGQRTATVRAIRDGAVLRLTRADFDDICQSAPALWNAVAATLASRLAAETRRSAELRRSAHDLARAAPRPRTIALIQAGPAPIPDAFMAAFRAAVPDRTGTLIVAARDIAELTESSANGSAAETAALNDLESRYHTIVFVADAELTPWSEKAIRQADAVLAVGSHPEGPLGSAVPCNALEAFAGTLHKPQAFRLALVHARASAIQGTRHWLANRQPLMHHHVALTAPESVARLWRFLSGEALGLVACGGGAYCAAHIGVYKALREAGTALDFLGGTSGGAAMAAAFAQNLDPVEIDARVHRMFIEGKALARYTLPRYSLLDHTHFDRHLQNEYGNVCIEDVWLPFFAVSADLASTTLEVHRHGPLWQAIRASAAIPGLLPPFINDDGRMLVDGSVIANVPLEVMHALKHGPNIVVSFDTPDGSAPQSNTPRALRFDYAALPGRRELLWRWLNPFAAGSLPAAPSAATVLVRSLMANRSHYERHLGPGDWLLVPPTPDDMGALDWRRHSALVEAAYRHTAAELAARTSVRAPPG